MPGEDRVEAAVRVAAGGVEVDGDLAVPPGARGVVLFAHGSGSSRFSPRNRAVARALQRVGLATLLLDLLTPKEDAADQRTAEYRFDIPRLGERLAGAVDWLAADARTAGLPVGCFGASTGAAAALVAAARRPGAVRAVVSRGGRPDLAAEVLAEVRAPTLLIVGERDPAVLELNQEVLPRLGGEARLEVVPGATHLFEEPGALGRVAELAARWFLAHLGA